MAYNVHRIGEMEQLGEGEVFYIDHYQWTKGEKPKAYGKMGLYL